MHMEWAGDFFSLAFYSNYLNCKAVVFLNQKIPPFMHLKKGTIRKRSWAKVLPYAIQVMELQLVPV